MNSGTLPRAYPLRKHNYPLPWSTSFKVILYIKNHKNTSKIIKNIYYFNKDLNLLKIYKNLKEIVTRSFQTHSVTDSFSLHIILYCKFPSLSNSSILWLLTMIIAILLSILKEIGTFLKSYPNKTWMKLNKEEKRI